MALAAPHAELHLVVGVVGAGVENIDLVRLVVGADIAVPEIAVDEGRLDGAPIGFEWS